MLEDKLGSRFPCWIMERLEQQSIDSTGDRVTARTLIPKRLRRMLIFSVVLVNLLILALSVQGLLQDLHQAELRAAMMTQAIANALDQSISALIEKIDFSLRLVVDELERQQLTRGHYDEAALNAFLIRQGDRLPEIDAYRVTDAKGAIILGKGVVKSDQPSNADRDYFIYLRDHDDQSLYVTKPIWGRIVKQYIIIFARRINNPDGSFAGEVHATVLVRHFGNLLKHYDMGVDGFVMLRDADFGLVSRLPYKPDDSSDAMSDRYAMSGLMEKINAGAVSATAKSVDIPGKLEWIVSVHRKSSRAPLTAVAGVADESYLTEWRSDIFKTSATHGVFLVICCGLGWLVVRLINELEQREVKLSNSEELYRQAFEVNTAVKLVVDPVGGKIIDANQAAAAFYGFTKAQLLNLRISDINCLSTDEIRQEMAAAESMRRQFFNFRHRLASGEVREVEVYSGPAKVGERNLLYSIVHDVTERKRAEAELTVYQNRLENLVEQRTAALEQAKLAAEAASVAKSAFISNMSHEIRTPLNAITGLVRLIQRSGVAPEQSERLTKIDVASRHLLEILNDILDLSKIEAGRFLLEESTVNIDRIMDNVVSIISDRLEAKGLALKVDRLEAPLNVIGDTVRIQQALLNYATNAVKFTEKGSVILRARVLENADQRYLVRFEVEDTGIGLADKTIAQLFSVFEQADSSITRKYGGTGLGLAIVKRLAQLMDGEAGVVSTLGKGSIFWFTVWLNKCEEIIVNDDSGTGESPDRVLLNEFPGRRILLTEDDMINREVAGELLREVGQNVDTAEDGLEAVELANQNQYDIILMDMQMPNMDGLTATRLIRAMPNGAEIPILALTANAFAEDRERCLDAGMNDFIVKPIDPPVFFETLVKWLRIQRV